MSISAKNVSDDWLIHVGGALLREAWQPPCISYSEEFLQWLWEHPSGSSAAPQAVGGFEGEEAIGVAALLPRRLLFRGRAFGAFHLCLVAVRPNWQGQGAAKRIYAKLLESIPSEMPVIAYARENSPAENVLKQSFQRSGWESRSLGDYEGFGYLARGLSDAASPTHVECIEKPEEIFPEFIKDRSFHDRKLLTLDWDQDQIAHWKRRPGGSTILVVNGADGQPQAAGIAYQAEIEGRQGLERVTTALRPVILESSNLEGILAAYLANAAKIAENRRFLSCPNLTGIDKSVFKRLGIRRIGDAYGGWLFFRGEDPLENGDEAYSTLEVV